MNDIELTKKLATGKVICEPEDGVRVIEVNYLGEDKWVLAHLPRRQVIILSRLEMVELDKILAQPDTWVLVNRAALNFLNKACS